MDNINHSSNIEINPDSPVVFDYSNFTSETLILPTNYVGYWIIGDLNIGTFKKPHWVHRIFSKLLLGWEWKSVTNKLI